MSVIIPDIEIEDKDKDSLKFTRYVNALHEIIINSKTQFTIGLFGGWGRGKTSIMKMLEKKLRGERFDNQGKLKDLKDLNSSKLYIPIWFDAWMYERESNLLTPFLDNFRYQMNEIFSQIEKKNLSRLSKRIGQVVFKLLKATSVELGVGGSKVTFDSSKALEAPEEEKKECRSVYFQSIQEIQEIFERFTEILEPKKVAFVFFIDDLDRCLPEKALHVLEIVKNLIFIKGYFFVVGLDPKPIENYINYKYKELSTEDDKDLVRGDQYIKKIFQIAFEIPPITESIAKEFIEDIIDNSKSFGKIKDIDILVNYLKIDSDFNPREIKRFMNKMILHASIKQFSNWDEFFKIHLFSFRDDFKEFYKHLKEKGAPLLRYICKNNLLESSKKKEFEEIKNKVVDNNPKLKEYLDEKNNEFFDKITNEKFNDYFYLQ